MRRRDLLRAAAIAPLAWPAVAQPVGARTLVFVPQANLTSLDPVCTTATDTRNYAHMVFDTLFGTDDALAPRPQMAEGHTVEDYCRRWTIKLRPGLVFHDGAPVLSRDCVASQRRSRMRCSSHSAISSSWLPGGRTSPGISRARGRCSGTLRKNKRLPTGGRPR